MQWISWCSSLILIKLADVLFVIGKISVLSAISSFELHRLKVPRRSYVCFEFQGSADNSYGFSRVFSCYLLLSIKSLVFPMLGGLFQGLDLYLVLLLCNRQLMIFIWMKYTLFKCYPNSVSLWWISIDWWVSICFVSFVSSLGWWYSVSHLT